jgi:hypothetical protein
MKNWTSLPILLKGLSIVLLLWVMMTIAVSIKMPEREIAFFGLLLKGASATAVVLLLDIISPLIFLYSMWKKLKWGAIFGMIYNGIFILNSIIALFIFKEVFGNAIYFPLVASIIFFSAIFKERKYFS